MAGDLQKRVSVILDVAQGKGGGGGGIGANVGNILGGGGGGGGKPSGGIGGMLANLFSPGNKNGLLAGILGSVMGGGGGSMGGMTSAAGSMIGEALGGPLGAIVGQKVGQVVGKILDSLQHPVETFKKLASEIAGYVQAANPQVVERFNMATKDLTAIFGHALTPAMEAFTDVVRSVADSLASTDIMGSFRSMFKELGRSFDEMKPILQSFVYVVGQIVSMLVRDVADMAKVFNFLNMGTGELAAAMMGGGGTKQGASVGLAAQGASFTGLEEFGRQAALATAGSGKGPAETTADNTTLMVDLLAQLVGAKNLDIAVAAARRGILGF